MIALLLDPQMWAAFFTLTALELVLGIDNIIFISILVDKLPEAKREATRRLGLFLAMFMRIGLLLTLSWVIGMTRPWLVIADHGFSGRDLVLLLGGLFLLWKSVGEIHETIETVRTGGEGAGAEGKTAGNTFAGIVLQIMLIDVVFSLDSIITAVGMVDMVEVMIAAVVAAAGITMRFAGPIGRFISTHPTFKMLALAFLVVVAVVLVAEGFGNHVPKGYIYSAMAFAATVELLNMSLRKPATRKGLAIAHVAEEKPDE